MSEDSLYGSAHKLIDATLELKKKYNVLYLDNKKQNEKISFLLDELQKGTEHKDILTLYKEKYEDNQSDKN
jgi:hypothetical protein